jgi:hypothetical protein
VQIFQPPLHKHTPKFSRIQAPSTHRIGPFGPTTALRMRKDGVPASPWIWAKARSKQGAVIRLCGDGAMPNVAIMGVLRIVYIMLGRYELLPLLLTRNIFHAIHGGREESRPESVVSTSLFQLQHRPLINMLLLMNVAIYQ